MVGTPVGRADGSTDGLPVVGVAVGFAVSGVVGLLDELSVGRVVVGTTLGCALGSTVGSVAGSAIVVLACVAHPGAFHFAS